MSIDPQSIKKTMDISPVTFKCWIKTERLEGPRLLPVKMCNHERQATTGGGHIDT